MEEKAKTENDLLSKEDLLDLIDTSSRYIRIKSLSIRVIMGCLIIMCFFYFVGFGNQSPLQHIMAGIELVIAYFLGRNDFSETMQLAAIEKLKHQVAVSKNIVFRIEEFDFPTIKEVSSADESSSMDK